MQAEKVTKSSFTGKIIFHIKEKSSGATFWRKKFMPLEIPHNYYNYYNGPPWFLETLRWQDILKNGEIDPLFTVLWHHSLVLTIVWSCGARKKVLLLLHNFSAFALYDSLYHRSIIDAWVG